MNVNETPNYDASDNPTGCCPRFKPEGWEGQALHFKDKPFVRAKTRSLFHIPINMGRVFEKTFGAIEAANALNEKQAIILSRDLSPWTSEHLFAVTKDVPGETMETLSGDYLTKVFEGPYKDAPKWEEEVKSYVAGQGQTLDKTYYFYTTCPKCVKYYGKNYVVALAKTGGQAASGAGTD